jgi:hypothetical protein
MNNQITFIPVQLMNQFTNGEYKLLMYLLIRSNLTGWKFHTIEISKSTGIDRKTVRTLLKKFISLKWISQDDKKIYQFNYAEYDKWINAKLEMVGKLPILDNEGLGNSPQGLGNSPQGLGNSPHEMVGKLPTTSTSTSTITGSTISTRSEKILDNNIEKPIIQKVSSIQVNSETVETSKVWTVEPRKDKTTKLYEEQATLRKREKIKNDLISAAEANGCKGYVPTENVINQKLWIL